jgi:hypothetical protein
MQPALPPSPVPRHCGVSIIDRIGSGDEEIFLEFGRGFLYASVV